MKMSLLSNDLKPREKLLRNGVRSLSDIELLAIMLGVGTKEESVLDLSQRLISEYGLKNLFMMNYNELKNIKGIKEAKATKLLSAFEITRRVLEVSGDDRELLYAKDLYDYIKNDYILEKKEILTVVYVNNKCVPIKKERFMNNEVSNVFVPEKRIIKEALDLECAGIFMVHNHPSGNPYPSNDDIEVTKDIASILKRINMHLFDHIIIANDRFYSILESKLYDEIEK